MAELPELERERKKLNQLFVGQRFRAISLLKESWANVSIEQLQQGLVGRQLLYVERRAKGIVFHLDDGRRLLLTVGNGALFHSAAVADEESDINENTETIAVTGNTAIQPQLRISFDQGSWDVTGARTLSLQWLSAKEMDDIAKEWGLEPLSRNLNAALFQNRFAKRRTALRTALTNQALIAGISPAIADEICFRAGIVPTVKTETLSSSDWEAIYNSMVQWLQEAIEQPESTFYAVSGRQGEPCSKCRTKLSDAVISGKVAVYCSSCQHEHAPEAVCIHG
ncbi:DNA-formamidopyrimidine glycosylase family protein [Paenibacillus arenosi]|uniref:Formamidopyrimidine-DNA glycosylase n=1 Tax=Paenibacillus arenosi TaxID=2774142 RepID=A0ABR9ATN2_9BACL|nr:DNA-formamidopyrimidine glycosylase family protein [Paenibacillus arenosi]MBD8497473.1 NFACT family protein [Paenibacillus arenosi]